ncbi:hypothetical protein N7E81_07540 [Reichenbachiella carrageenanivorans]|uniref:Transglutaminase-like superfamily protein n=1 Tax=Reichenbachiella carrageenanivorans TaxID=2979869 RepID=A0ABY6D480_9BACT|nr:hypothetical protein [Reichenbachiella carrageenanivorans]UXX80951.1 hypothetical protein N7E81_07540 [Reichenbachiella carrageenanivorans]
MKKILIGLVLLTLHATTSQATGDKYLSSDTKLGLFIRSEFDDLSPEEVLAYEQNYAVLLTKLKEKQKLYKSDAAFLKHVFYTVHRKMLGEYEQYVTFSEIFKKEKKYDCVTGTAMFALVLDELGVSYEVHETDYHVYLVAFAGGKEYLFESTDPLNGFAWEPKEIAERRMFVNEESIRINTKLAMSGLASDDVDLQGATYIDNVVDLRQLAGLHYYNQALKHFNNNDLRDAYRMIIIAQGIYPTPRIKGASAFMFAAAFED